MPSTGFTGDVVKDPKDGKKMVSHTFHFSPDPWGFMIQFDVAHIFQSDWLNHRGEGEEEEFIPTAADSEVCLGLEE